MANQNYSKLSQEVQRDIDELLKKIIMPNGTSFIDNVLAPKPTGLSFRTESGGNSTSSADKIVTSSTYTADSIEPLEITTSSISEALQAWKEMMDNNIATAMGIPPSFYLGENRTPCYVTSMSFSPTEVDYSNNMSINYLADFGPMATPYNGMSIKIVETWVRGFGWRYYSQPRMPPRGKRKGTRKQWKKANPQGWRWRYGPIEPAEAIFTEGVLCCTRKQYDALVKATQTAYPYRGPAVPLRSELERIPHIDRNNTYYEGGDIVVPHSNTTED